MVDPGNEADLDEVDGNIRDDGGNVARAALSKGVLEYLARAIVEFPDEVSVDVEDARGGVMLRLHVAPDDMGRVIGRRGRVATAVRTVVRAAGAREGVDARVDIVD